MRFGLRSGAPALAAGFLATVIAACGAAGGAGSHSAAGAPRHGPISIGAVLSLTGGGDVYGPQQLRAADLAIDQINAAGGVEGSPLRLVVRNDRSDPATGASEMRDLISNHRVVAVIGPTLSLVAVRADPIADQLQTPVLAVSNTADGIVGDCAYPCRWIWRDSLGEQVAVRAAIADYVQGHHPGTAIVVQTSNDVLGNADAKHAASAFAANGVRVLAHLTLARSADVAAALRPVLAHKPDVLFVGTTFGSFAARTIDTARKLGFTGAILGGNVFNSAQTGVLAGAAGLDAQSGAAWWEGNDFPANQSFITGFRQAYGVEPDQFAAQAYAGVQILADALRRARVDAASQTLVEQRSALQASLGDVAISTVLGPFRFTADHDVHQIVWILAMNGGGSHRLVGFCNPGC